MIIVEKEQKQENNEANMVDIDELATEAQAKTPSPNMLRAGRI